MQTLDYASWTMRLKRQVGDRRVPLGGTLELTHRCNNRCRHCFNNLRSDDAPALGRELSTREVARILDEAAALGCVWVLLTGGETLLRPDFRDIYDHARGLGLLVTLFTNGTLVTPELADHLDRQRPFSVEITLYGATRETYERVTANPGSYDACLRGIRLLRERGLPLKLKSTVSTLNRHEIAAMKRLAEDDLGLPFRFDALLNPRCDGRPGPLALRLTAEEVVALDLADPARAEALREFAACHPTDRVRRRALPVRRRRPLVRGRPVRPPARLRHLAGGGVRPARGFVPGGLGALPGAAARAEAGHGCHVPVVRAAGPLRNVPGQRRARVRRRAPAGRLPVPGGAPARARVRHPRPVPRALRVLPRRGAARRAVACG